MDTKNPSMRRMSRTTTNAQKTPEKITRTRTRPPESLEEEEHAETSRRIVRDHKNLLVKLTNKKTKLRIPLKEMQKSPRERETAEEEVELMMKELNPEKTLKAKEKDPTPTLEVKPLVMKTKKVQLDTKAKEVVANVEVNADPEVETTTTTMMDLVKITVKDPPAETTTKEMKVRATRVMLTTKEVVETEDQESPEHLEKKVRVKATVETVEIAVENVEIVNPENLESPENQEESLENPVSKENLENPESLENPRKVKQTVEAKVEDAVDVVVEAVVVEEEAQVRMPLPATTTIEVTTEHQFSTLIETISLRKALATLRNPCTINNNNGGVLCAPGTLCETPV